MIKEKVVLMEKNGSMYLQGAPVRLGDAIEIDGVTWKVLSAGRSTGPNRAPFVWIRSEHYGTSILFMTAA